MIYTLDDTITLKRLYDFTCASMPPSYECPKTWPEVIVDMDLQVMGRYHSGGWIVPGWVELADWGSTKWEGVLVHEFVHYIQDTNGIPMVEEVDEHELLARHIQKRYLLTTQVTDNK